MNIFREVTADDRKEMARMVKAMLGEKSDLWWTTDNQNFGGIPPTFMVGTGERILRNFIFDAYEEHVASNSATAPREG